MIKHVCQHLPLGSLGMDHSNNQRMHFNHLPYWLSLTSRSDANLADVSVFLQDACPSFIPDEMRDKYTYYFIKQISNFHLILAGRDAER